MNHYHHLIQEFGTPNDLCSSITELKHIKAVKKPWQCLNHFKALGQMLVTNQHLDKLTAAQVDFETHHMLKGSILSASIRTLDCPSSDHSGHSQHHVGSAASHASHNDNDGTDTDDEIEVHDGPHVLNYVCLAKTPGMSAIFCSSAQLNCVLQHTTIPVIYRHLPITFFNCAKRFVWPWWNAFEVYSEHTILEKGSSTT